jgi:hypothetical protein
LRITEKKGVPPAGGALARPGRPAGGVKQVTQDFSLLFLLVFITPYMFSYFISYAIVYERNPVSTCVSLFKLLKFL